MRTREHGNSGNGKPSGRLLCFTIYRQVDERKAVKGRKAESACRLPPAACLPAGRKDEMINHNDTHLDDHGASARATLRKTAVPDNVSVPSAVILVPRRDSLVGSLIVGVGSSRAQQTQSTGAPHST